MREAFDALQQRILHYLADPGGDFGALALEIFRFQFSHIAPYRAFCESLSATPQRVRSWEEIPAVPAQAFREDAPLTSLPVSACQRVFLTSGTTGEVRGRHYLAHTDLYEASVRCGWARAGLPRGLPTLFLSQAPWSAPDSSLACMFGFLLEPEISPPIPWMVGADGSIRIQSLREACEAGQALLLFSTALALRHLFERFPDALPLPAGSWVFQTGGYKGLATTYDAAALYREIETRLHVSPDHIINEYGMTELSTPSYALGFGEPHRTPPWLKVRTMDPETGRPADVGAPGHLVFLDLANLNSVAALRTQDLACSHDEHTFTLTGRDPSALPRGCSRASDAHLRSS